MAVRAYSWRLHRETKTVPRLSLCGSDFKKISLDSASQICILD